MSSDTVTFLLSALTLLSDIVIVAFTIFLVMARKGNRFPVLNTIISFTGKHALALILAVTATGFISTLYYSEIVGFEPCKLCWFQRIFLYPQLAIVAVALIKKLRGVASYLIPLSILGAIVALYHYTLQMGGTPLIPCSADVALSCSKRFIFEFGYISESVMAFTSFMLIIVLSMARNRYEKDQIA